MAGSSFSGGAISIDLSEVYALSRALGAQAETIVREENRRAMGQAIPVAQNEVRKRMPERTGRMKREWAIRIQAVGRAIIGEAASTAMTMTRKGPHAYAQFVELGHWLVAWGHWTNYRVPGRFMFLHGTAAAEPKVQAIFDAAATRIASRLERLR